MKFYESFDEAFDGKWIVSEKEEYSGVWKHAKSEGHDDYGLLVSEKARKYAIVKELDNVVDLKDGTVVLQYEVRLQEGLECGGAYLKYLRPQEAGWTAKGFDNASPYTVMFGPDKCGATNKVHFILKHKNPKSGEFIEHHLKFPPSVPSDKLTHVYTAVLKPDNEVLIFVDGEEKRRLTSFQLMILSLHSFLLRPFQTQKTRSPRTGTREPKFQTLMLRNQMIGMRTHQWKLKMRKLRSLKDGWMMSLRRSIIPRPQSLKIGMMRRMVYGRLQKLTTQNVRKLLDVGSGKDQ